MQSPSTQIINGIPLSQVLPWFAILINYRYNTPVLCGSTYIGNYHNHSYFISAAHCFEDRNTNWTSYAYLNTTDIDFIIRNIGIHTCPPPHCFEIETIQVHPEYDPTNFRNDIALFRLGNNVSFSDELIQLPFPNMDYKKIYCNEKVEAFGIGIYSLRNQSLSHTLRKGDLFLLNDTMYPVYDMERNIASTFLANNLQNDSDESNNIDTCQGDSGGPVLLSPHENTIIGITSWGYECALNQYPGVYTYVPYYLSWIYSILM